MFRYKLPAEKTTTFSIGKATHSNQTANGSAKFGASGTADLSALIVDGGTVGEITKADAENVLNGEPSVAAGKLNFAFVNETEKVGKTATVTVPVTSANYEDYSITVTLTVSDKNVPTLTVSPITTCIKFIQLVKSSSLRQSMSRRGNCWDNAPQESFFGHMKDELAAEIPTWTTFEDVCRSIDDWMEYYNNDRCQWDLAKLSPNEYYDYITTGAYPPHMLPPANGSA